MTGGMYPRRAGQILCDCSPARPSQNNYKGQAFVALKVNLHFSISNTIYLSLLNRNHTLFFTNPNFSTPHTVKMYAAAILMTIVAAVSAAPSHPGDVDVDVNSHKSVKTVQEVGDVCGNNNTVHCCNSESANKAVGGLLGLNLDNILSGCQEINIPVLAVNVPFKDVCTQQAICCGDVKQNVSL